MANSMEGGGDVIRKAPAAKRKRSTPKQLQYSQATFAILEAAWICHQRGTGKPPEVRLSAARWLLVAILLAGSQGFTDTGAAFLYQWLRKRVPARLTRWLELQPHISTEEWKRLVDVATTQQLKTEIVAWAGSFLALAGSLARETAPGTNTIRLRHLIGLFLAIEPQDQEVGSTQSQFQADFGLSLAEFRPDFLAWLTPNLVDGETETAWHVALGMMQGETPHSKVQATFPDALLRGASDSRGADQSEIGAAQVEADLRSEVERSDSDDLGLGPIKAVGIAARS